MDFEITSPEGQKFIITAPEGATQEQVLKYAQENFQAPHKAPTQPKWYEIEKQPGVPKTIGEQFKQIGKDALEELRSPIPGSFLTAPIKEASKLAGQTGADVARKTGSRTAGFVTQTALDPLTWEAGPEAGLITKAFGGVGKTGNSILKTIMKIGANVNDKAIEEGAKAGWKLPNVKPAEIEIGVQNVQNALKEAVEHAGTALDEAKSKIGIPVTVAEKEAAIKEFGNIYGLSKDEGALASQYLEKTTSPEKLAETITKFKEDGRFFNKKELRAKVAQFLQDKVNELVDPNKKGSQIQGLLKQQANHLKNIVQESVPKSIRERMAKALSLQDDLEKLLGLTENEGIGKAEQFLRSLFEGKSAKSKDYLKRLADLEVMTGKPVLQELFKKFAGQDLHKLAGRAYVAQGAGTLAVGASLGGNPLLAGTAGLAALTQSPRALNAIGRTASNLSGAAQKVTQLGARGLRGFAIQDQSNKNKAELERLMQRLKHAK